LAITKAEPLRADIIMVSTRVDDVMWWMCGHRSCRLSRDFVDLMPMTGGQTVWMSHCCSFVYDVGVLWPNNLQNLSFGQLFVWLVRLLHLDAFISFLPIYMYFTSSFAFIP
jgi:hypothetical protein